MVAVGSTGVVVSGTATPAPASAGSAGAVVGAGPPSTRVGRTGGRVLDRTTSVVVVTTAGASSTSSRSVVKRSFSPSATAISFCLSGAVAKLTPAKRATPTMAAVAHTSRARDGGVSVFRRPLSHERMPPLRIGVSTQRNDSSVTQTVAAIPIANCRTVIGLPATPRMIMKIGQW